MGIRRADKFKFPFRLCVGVYSTYILVNVPTSDAMIHLGTTYTRSLYGMCKLRCDRSVTVCRTPGVVTELGLSFTRWL